MWTMCVCFGCFWGAGCTWSVIRAHVGSFSSEGSIRRCFTPFLLTCLSSYDHPFHYPCLRTCPVLTRASMPLLAPPPPPL